MTDNESLDKKVAEEVLADAGLERRRTLRAPLPYEMLRLYRYKREEPHTLSTHAFCSGVGYVRVGKLENDS